MPITVREMFGIAGIITENLELGREHYNEIALNKGVMVYNPDAERFQSIEDQGFLLSVGVFDGDTLVGYTISIIGAHLHYSDLICAFNDMIYVHPNYRRGGVGLRLINETKRLAKERGVQFMTWHAKKDTPLAALLPKLGCKVQDIVFSEEI
jgi:GNAT superfamily N-acetyltransferase